MTGPGLVSAFYEAIETRLVLSQHLHEDNFQALFTLCTPTALRLWPPYFLLSWYLFALNKIFSALLFLSER